MKQQSGHVVETAKNVVWVKNGIVLSKKSTDRTTLTTKFHLSISLCPTFYFTLTLQSISDMISNLDNKVRCCLILCLVL